MRPIFNPSARVNVEFPSRVGCGADAGCTRSSDFPEALPIFAVANLFLGGGIALAVSAVSTLDDFGGFAVAGCGLSAGLSTEITAAVCVTAVSAVESEAFAVCMDLAFAYNSITSRFGLFSRE